MLDPAGDVTYTVSLPRMGIGKRPLGYLVHLMARAS